MLHWYATKLTEFLHSFVNVNFNLLQIEGRAFWNVGGVGGLLYTKQSAYAY